LIQKIYYEERKMANQKCISITVRKGIWDAFNEIGSKKEINPLELIEEILIDYIVNNMDDYRRFPDLIDDQDLIKARPPC
jgi:hypothetical protein